MTTAIHIKNLTKRYGKNLALDSIDLDVAEGEFFGLLGPNGAGKSTTIGILTGLVVKTSGKAKIFDYETTEEYKKSRQIVGVVPQEFNFDTFQTVEKALLTTARYFGMSERDARHRIAELLELLELQDKQKAMIQTLSGGMKRRLLIVRALLHSPKILILDEPTAGVDVELRRKMWKIMQQFNDEGMTILLTTHYLEEAEALCNRIAIIDKGKILLNEDRNTLLHRLQSKSYLVNFSEGTELPDHLKKKFHAVQCSRIKTLEHLGNESSNCYRVHFEQHEDLTKFLQECVKLNLKIEDIFAEKERLEDFFVRFLAEGE